MQSRPRRVLIVSASIGYGHNQAAKAIACKLSTQPQMQVNIVDFMADEISYLNSLIKETYFKMLALSPNVYDLLYRWTQASAEGEQVANLLAAVMKKRMEKLIVEYKPDLVVCTHPFPCGAAAYLKKNRKVKTKLAAVITDYALHQLWIYKEVDLYFVGDVELKCSLQKHSILGSKIIVTGIPISSSFSQINNDCTIMSDLKLSNNLPTILIMGGGLGLGGVRETLESLEAIPKLLQILVVTGENRSLRQGLTVHAATSKHKIHIFGFTKQIAELMISSDLLITKPGALTISEALAMKLPMVFFQPIPGQERDNAAHITQKGAAVLVETSAQLKNSVERLISHPSEIQSMKARAAMLSKPRAVDDIAAELCSTLVGYNIAGNI
ncbi:MGDG synthase family glycosyltransferase [Dendrosporobacter sp. 1207_IL3150]|uniref:MGDG synthase family glycosyltransferase n=1 Tax=Dendrosporobacter sp. 1207_IL3150 TaxID=3084054 RepID=UPI002FDB169A